MMKKEELLKRKHNFLFTQTVDKLLKKIMQSMGHPRTILTSYYHPCSKRETGYFSVRKYSFSQHKDGDNL